MIKKKILAALCVCLLGTSLLTSACGLKKQHAPEATPTPAASPTPVPTNTPVPTPTAVPLKTIGAKAEGAYEVRLKNMTGKEISGVSVKEMEEAEYPANLLAEGDVVAVDEQRILYYTPAPQEEQAQAEGEKLLEPGYNVLLTFTDGMTLELHGFPFGDIKEGELYALDGVAYLTYNSVSTQEAVNTKEAELAILQNAAAQETWDDGQYYEEPYTDTYTEPYTDAYTEPYTDPYTDPYGGYTDPYGGYTDPYGGYTDSYVPPVDGGGDACLDDGLVY